MKKFTALMLALMFCLSLAACGGAASSSSGGAEKDYGQIIRDARTEEDNQYQTLFTGAAGEEPAVVDGGDEWTQENIQSTFDMMLQTLGLTGDQLDKYAVSMSMMNVRAYAVGIFKPAEGQTDAVKGALDAYVKAQQQSFQNYLADQYEVAKAAKLETLPGGEVVLVMCEDGAAVFEAIQKALK